MALRSFHFFQRDCEIPKCQQCVKISNNTVTKTLKEKHNSICTSWKAPQERRNYSYFIQFLSWCLPITDNEDKAGYIRRKMDSLGATG